MMISTVSVRFFGLLSVGWVVGMGLVRPEGALAQPAPTLSVAIPLNDLSAFASPASNWRIVGSVRADLNKANTLTTEKGTGVLANVLTGTTSGQKVNLLTNFQHGDADLDLDYMIATGSNSGVYLQGRYEVQLFDSWSVQRPTTTDNGAIYERWDEKRPDGQKGYGGHPPRQNASRAPGLWQHLKISFQAPRFGTNGQKTDNARLIRVELNGVLVQDNVELTGPTRSAVFDDEKATGPLLFQGDHGAVAFRNIRYVSYDKPRPELMNLKYSVYKGKYEKEPEYDKTAPESEGTTTVLSSAMNYIQN